MRYGSAVLTTVMLAGVATVATASVKIYGSDGVPLSFAVEGLPGPVSGPSTVGSDPTIDLWCCGADPLDWSLNSDFYWATAFDTNDISDTHEVTEILWYSDGGEDETYWIAPDAAGFPDTSGAVLLGSQSVPESPFMWQSFDASGAGATVEPNQVYWLIRAALGQGFDMTWRSTTNPNPPVEDPVAISTNFDSGWFKWVSGENWHMEYEIRGIGPCEIRLSLEQNTISAGDTLVIAVDLRHNRRETVSVPLAFWIEDAKGNVLLRRVTTPRTFHPGDELSEDYVLTLPDNLAPGEYHLAVGVEEMQQGKAWAQERFMILGAP